MKHLIAAVFLALVFSSCAEAANWAYLEDIPTNNAPPSRSELDLDSIHEKEGVAGATLRVVYAEPPKNFKPISGKVPKAMQVKIEFNCASRLYREIGRALVDSKDELIMSTDKSPDTPFQALTPDHEPVYLRVCAEKSVPPSTKYMGNPIELKVKNIGARALLRGLADTVGLNIVVSDELRNTPVTVQETAVRWDELLDRLIYGQGLSMRTKARNVVVIASPCRLSGSNSIPEYPQFNGKLSLSFQSIESTALMSIFSDYLGMRIDAPAQDNGVLMIRSRDVLIRDYLDILSMAQGWTLKTTDEKALSFAYNDRRLACDTGRERETTLPPKLPQDSKPSSGSCPRAHLFPSQTACMPLEGIPLESMHFPGFMRLGSQPLVFAFVVTKDGTTYTVRKGHYIGNNIGKIENIDENGVTISEWGAEGENMKQTTRLVPYD
jgi:hypothetical protein